MKKLLLLTFAVVAFNFVNAQTTPAPAPPADTLKEYTGKYKFPDGSPFSEVNVTLENGVLSASSAAGSSELKRREGDVFDVVAYGGTATFKRNDTKKIIKVQIQVNDLDIEGDKAEEGKLSDIFWRYRK